MKIIKQKNKIIVEDENFNIRKILECGQIFSFKELSPQSFLVVSTNKFAKVNIISNTKTEITTKYVDYFLSFFDLNTDYKLINKKIIAACKDFEKYVKGELRILRQDPFQTIISFIVSANNNIKRIKKILFEISHKYGTYIEEYGEYAFPSLKQLLPVTEEEFGAVGCGYRKNYLVKAIKMLNTEEFCVQNLTKLDSFSLKQKLMELPGVGPKVADCILLFGFSRTDFFPVDTWIRKSFAMFSNEKKTDKQISQYFVNIFKDVSGYAQQYLYDYMINNT